MLVAKVFSAAALAASVLADGKGIIGAIDTIRTQVDALGEAVSSWSGNALGILPLSIKSTLLHRDLLHGDIVVSTSGPLSLDEYAQIANATEALAARVDHTLEIVISAKAKFGALLLRPVVHLRLELQKAAAHDFATRVAAKLPVDMQASMGRIIQAFDGEFDKAIAAYRLLNL